MDNNEVEEVVSVQSNPSLGEVESLQRPTVLERLVEVEVRSKSNTHRLNEHAEQLKMQQQQLDVLKKMNDNIENIATSMKDVKSDVDVLKNDKISRDAVDNYWKSFWNSTVGKITYEAIKYIVIGVFLAYVVTQFGGFF